MRLRIPALAATAAVTALIAAGCGDESKDTATAGSGETTMEHPMGEDGKASQGGGVESGASELRASLTGLLEDHVYLAGTAITTGLSAGLDSKDFKAAAGTLDKNSVALSKAIGGVYGDDAGEQFLALWRKHIDFFVNYTKARATKDAAAARQAKADLDGYRKDFGAFLASANPNLPADAVAKELKPHVETVFATIDAAVAGSPKVFDRLAEAASHMPMTAKVLAGGIAKQFPDKFDGSAESAAAELRSGLTAQLTDHTYLAGIAIAQGVGEGLDSKPFKAAAATLDENSVALSKSIASVYGKDAGEQFLALWRKHIGFFVDYTKAKASGDEAGADQARSDLDGYRKDFGAFLASANPNLPADAVAEELKPHVDTVFATIDAVVEKSPETFDRLAEAASHMPMTAKVLAGGIAKQFPDKFPSE